MVDLLSTTNTSIWDESGTNSVNVNGDSRLEVVSYDNANRTAVWNRETLTTTTTTANQVIGSTYTPPTGNIINLSLIMLCGEKTTPDGTSTILGRVAFQVTVNGSTWITLWEIVLRTGITGASTNAFLINIPNGGIVVTGDGTIAFRAIVTPATTTSIDWQFALIGHTFPVPT